MWELKDPQLKRSFSDMLRLSEPPTLHSLARVYRIRTSRTSIDISFGIEQNCLINVTRSNAFHMYQTVFGMSYDSLMLCIVGPQTDCSSVCSEVR